MAEVKIPDERSEHPTTLYEQLVACGVVPRKTVHKIKIFEPFRVMRGSSLEQEVNDWLANKRPDQRVVDIQYDNGNILIFYTEYEEIRVNYEDGEC